VIIPGPLLLDTNTFSYIANGRSLIARETLDSLLYRAPISISAITEGELLFGLARRPEATRLAAFTHELMSAVDIVPWDSAAALSYSALRLRMMQTGKSLTANDALIAAHALALGATLVTRDTAFDHIDTLRTVNWATDI
jgi:tRNA(fMet)-specific endonuclease VapC